MVDFRKHLKPRLDLNPSSADRWTTCTASPRFVLENADKLPPSDTVFSQEGTTAHEVASAYLLDRQPRAKDPYHCPTPIDADMRWHGWNYAEYVQGLRKPGSTLLVEQKLPLWYMPGRNAIVDAAVINHDSLHIIDYKYGAGVVVSPENNLQMSIYAKTIVANLPKEIPGFSDIFPIILHIYQPRARAGEPANIWETTWGEISRIAQGIEDAAKLVQIENKDGQEVAFRQTFKQVEFAPSEKACQWCPAKGFCPERQKTLTQDIEALTVISEKPLALPTSETISLEQIAAILQHKDNLEKWLKDVEKYAFQMLSRGDKIPGFKLVLSRGGNRYWGNPTQAAKVLLESTILKESEVWEKSVIGPAAAEKLLGKHKFGADLMNLIAKPPGKPTIAPAEDKREDCSIDGASEFTAIDDEIPF